MTHINNNNKDFGRKSVLATLFRVKKAYDQIRHARHLYNFF